MHLIVSNSETERQIFIRLENSVENHYFNAIGENTTINVVRAKLSDDRNHSRTTVDKNEVIFRLV